MLQCSSTSVKTAPSVTLKCCIQSCCIFYYTVVVSVVRTTSAVLLDKLCGSILTNVLTSGRDFRLHFQMSEFWNTEVIIQQFYPKCKNNTTTATFTAVVDPGMHISFFFTRCRYLLIFGILLLTM